MLVSERPRSNKPGVHAIPDTSFVVAAFAHCGFTQKLSIHANFSSPFILKFMALIL